MQQILKELQKWGLRVTTLHWFEIYPSDLTECVKYDGAVCKETYTTIYGIMYYTEHIHWNVASIPLN